MGLTRLSALLGLLCFLANVAWGVGCAYDSNSYDLDDKIERFAQKLDSNFVPSAIANPSKTAHILELNRTYVGKTLYCGVVMRLLVANANPYAHDAYEEHAINMRLMCFNITKNTLQRSQTFEGFCLSLYPASKSSQIGMEFKKDAFVLEIEESFIECDSTTFKSQTLLFKQEGDRYVLQSYTGTIDNDDPDPFYRQKRDGKKIYMDAIDNGVLDTLEDHCYKKHDCQTWEEKHGIE
ncbi:hypothetical protein FNE76_03980 [Helicobacter mehlei]|uniref:Lipoprotein n=2 Tax=Helicobacter mehlei TaxID=2316080 RepID=A0A553UX00_9HELI|nr:hypothetical protein FNE76_03980 [Helicobacter mehlei]